MQKCPQCGNNITQMEQECEACGAKISLLPAQQATQTEYKQSRVETVEAEIIDEEAEQRSRQAQQGFYGDGGPFTTGQDAFGRVHGRGWQHGGAFGHASRELSCLPGMVTLILGISLGIQLGFLASLGFFFFYILGSALAMGISVRRTLMGKKVNIWINRVLVWGLSYAIAFQLAS